MNYKFSSLKPILDCFYEWDILSPTDISDKIGKSKVIVHKYLKELVNLWKLIKIWKWTHTKYKSSNIGTPKKIYINNINLKYEEIKIIQNSFYKFSHEWNILEGIEWFINRCMDRNFNINEKTINYIKIKKHIDSIKNKCWLIDNTKNFKLNIKDMNMDKVFYADQYNRIEFGRWKLAEMTFFAKQSQNMKLIKKCIDMIIYQIKCLIKEENIEAIAIIPHSINRINQILKILNKNLLSVWLPFINITKYFPNNIPIPQKTLKSREQRIINAKNSIIINTKNDLNYKKILLIDDFIWSWSTLNETAKKLKDLWINKIIWFAFVGNTNMKYDIINEI